LAARLGAASPWRAHHDAFAFPAVRDLLVVRSGQPFIGVTTQMLTDKPSAKRVIEFGV
jgi:hypothetical protein